MSYAIRLIKFVGVPRAGHDRVEPGAWLQSYDPEAHDGQGDAVWTHDPARARRFGTPVDAWECYSQLPGRAPSATTAARTGRSRPRRSRWW